MKLNEKQAEKLKVIFDGKDGDNFIISHPGKNGLIDAVKHVSRKGIEFVELSTIDDGEDLVGEIVIDKIKGKLYVSSSCCEPIENAGPDAIEFAKETLALLEMDGYTVKEDDLC